MRTGLACMEPDARKNKRTRGWTRAENGRVPCRFARKTGYRGIVTVTRHPSPGRLHSDTEPPHNDRTRNATFDSPI